MNTEKILAVIPARSGSKGLPGKNIRLLAGLPLIAHSIEFARLCPAITRTIVSTDSEEIATVARHYGAEVPFMRPRELAQDDTPMWPVLRHALQTVEQMENRAYDFLILLDPTSPGRIPSDVTDALAKLRATPAAAGIIAVSQPEFNPVWHCVVERDGWMTDLIQDAQQFNRRQDVPAVYRINGSLYIWRTDFVRHEAQGWRQAHHVIYEMPEARAIHIDDATEFEKTDLLIRQGWFHLPWLENLAK
ncbi:MAG: acylneuraminate cytidylyltransferase family protein [Candidatus Atribacteria bacterium]|nr:acylneuraminate cytidylyltransferase family protein [Candidatus Atribacteria bacterium]